MWVQVRVGTEVATEIKHTMTACNVNLCSSLKVAHHSTLHNCCAKQPPLNAELSVAPTHIKQQAALASLLSPHDSTIPTWPARVAQNAVGSITDAQSQGISPICAYTMLAAALVSSNIVWVVAAVTCRTQTDRQVMNG